MWFINFIIAVAALVVAISAYQRTESPAGEGKDLLSSLREKVGDTFSKMGNALRKEDTKKESAEEEKKNDVADIEKDF